MTNMPLSASMGGLWGDFPKIFWIVEYVQKSIYIWNKIWKHMFSMWHGFSIYPFIYNIQFIPQGEFEQFNVLMVYFSL